MSKLFRRHLRRTVAGVLGVLVVALIFETTGLGAYFEQLTLDFRYAKLNRLAEPSDSVVFIDIDEESLKNLAVHYGRWPWPRRLYKDLIEFLAAGDPSAVLFDVMFTEPQVGSDDDRQFSEATRLAANVSQAAKFLIEPTRSDVSHNPMPSDVLGRFSLAWDGSAPPTALFPQTYHDFALPFPEMLRDLPRFHVVNAVPDADGIYRQIPLLVPYESKWYPGLGLAAILSQVKNPTLKYSNDALDILSEGRSTRHIPLEKSGLFHVHFYRAKIWPRSYRMAEVIESAAARLRGEDPSKWSVNPLDLAGKIIIIGATSTGLEDLKPTPVSRAFPGALLHATAISNILNDDFLRLPPAWLSWVAMLLLVVASYGSVFFIEWAFLKSVLPLTAFALYAGVAAWSFYAHNLALNLSLPLAGGLMAFVDGFVYISLIEGRERRRMTGTLSKYLSPEVTAMLAEDQVDPTAEIGKKKELSVMFTDVRGFTSLSEKMPPEIVVGILNEYLGKMTEIVFHNGGTLDKFIGDAVMAFWGAPLPNPKHAVQAVETGFAMRAELAHLNEHWRTKGLPKLEMGVGVNTGEVIVGNIGSERRLDYTVIGDNVNLASRLEGLTKYYGVDIILGPRTFEQVDDVYLCRPLDLVQVKGKAEAVAIHEPLLKRSESGPSAERIREFAALFGRAWNAYRLGRFADAIRLFQQCESGSDGGDSPSHVLIERCQDLMRSPPDSWSGVYVAKTK